MKGVMEMAMQELTQIAAAEEQARAICEQARAEAAELAVQAEKDGTARLNAVISGAQERMREAKQQAENQAAAFETDLNSKTAAQCRALEQADGLDRVFAHHITNKSGKYIVFCANKEHMDEMLSLIHI